MSYSVITELPLVQYALEKDVDDRAMDLTPSRSLIYVKVDPRFSNNAAKVTLYVSQTINTISGGLLSAIAITRKTIHKTSSK